MTRSALKISALAFLLGASTFSSASAGYYPSCRRIHIAKPQKHIPLFGRQVVFSSTQLDKVLSDLQKETRSESKTAALVHLKEARGAEFADLRERITIASETIDTLANDRQFKGFDERTKSLIYREITNTLLKTAQPEGIDSLFYLDSEVYFPRIPKNSPISQVISATKDLRTKGALDSTDREMLSEFIISFRNKVLASEKEVMHIDSQFALIQLTYRKGAARAEEITGYARTLVNALNEYDSALILRVNDLPISEAQYINTQLVKSIDRLNSVYTQISSEQRLELQVDRVMENLSRYQRRLAAEIARYPEREQESLMMAGMWTRMIKTPSSSYLPVGLD